MKTYSRAAHANDAALLRGEREGLRDRASLHVHLLDTTRGPFIGAGELARATDQLEALGERVTCGSYDEGKADEHRPLMRHRMASLKGA